MKCATLFLLVLLFYFNVGCFSNPVVDLNDKITLWVYKYDGQIEARNSNSNETLSRWTVSGILSQYSSLKHVVFKLDNVTTSLFNGERTNLKNAHEKEIPLESKALLEPFKIILTDQEYNYYYYFDPNDPLWSRNFKRGIVNNFNFIGDKFENSDNKIYKEKSIHGLCEVSYKVIKNEEEKILVHQKTINHDSCTELPQLHITNLKGKAPAVKDFENQHTKTIKTASYRHNGKGSIIPFEYVSTSNIIIRTMPSSLTTQHIDQHQKFEFIALSRAQKSDEPDISKATERHDVIYEASYDPTAGRHAFEKDTAALVKFYMDNYNNFIKYFVDSPVENINMADHDEIDNMILALLHMKAEGFEALQEAFSNTSDKNVQDITDEELFQYHRTLDLYYSFIPYIGTDEFVKYLIKNIDAEIDGFNMWGSKEMAATRILAIFPNFLEHPNEKLLKDLEVLLNLQHFRQKSAKNAGVLSFASVIVQVYKKDPSLSKDSLNKYIELYHDKFLQSDNYEQRMTYLLGLVNMADILDVDFINNIITNTSESQHIRTLAITGFKSRISHEDTKINHLYNIYWPIVQNKKETFEVRVAVLDLLLSLKLSDEQLNTIIKKYSLHFNNPQERQLANYVLTSLHSLQNTTAFFDNLGAQSSEALKNNHLPFFPKTFITGNYRISHTDENFGSYLQTRLITDPSTSALKLAQITYNSYGFSYNMGVYTLYFKVDGFMDSLYAEFFLKHMKNVSSVPELLKILKEGNFEMKEIKKDIHIDIVVFLDDVAVYSTHFGKWEKNELQQFANDVVQFLDVKLQAKYPFVDYKHIPTDLGTPLQIAYLVEDIMFLNFMFDIFHYRTTWSYQTWIQSYNPLVDTNIASYKYIASDKLINLNYTADATNILQLSWVTKNSSLAYYWDHVVGTSVEDEEILKQYCQDCNSYNGLEYEISKDHELGMEKLGLKQHTSIASMNENNFQNDLLTFLSDKNYDSNIDASPYAGPILFYKRFFNYKALFYNELSSGSYKLLPYWNEDMETTITVKYDENIKKILYPMIRKDYRFDVEVKHKLLDNENASCVLDWDLYFAWDSEHKNETTEEKNAVLTTKINFNYVSSHEENTKHVCIKRELNLPFTKSDKYSLEPVQPAIAKIFYKTSHDASDKTCADVLKSGGAEETFWSTDKTVKLQNKQNKKDYEECLQNSKGLKFVEPSSVCRRISSKLAEYDNYQYEALKTEYEVEHKIISTPVAQYSRPEEDYVNLAVLLGHEVKTNRYFNKTFYYPNIIDNPISFASGDYDYSLPFIATSTCTITPSTIEQFSGKFVPNQQESWLAFSECYNTATRGLKGRSVGKNHVEFEYYSKENVLNVGFKDGKAQIKLNGKELHESYNPNSNSDDINVFFLDDNVFYVYDKSFSIYYNTEYVQIKINSLHSKLLCGLCNKDQL